MAGSTPSHAVIIPHYNDFERLTRCLKEVANQHAALPNPAAVEVVVVDNASPGDLDSISSKFPNFRFVIEAKKGAASARNCGVAETTAPGLIFLDADCLPDAGWLLRAIGVDATGKAIGGRIDVFDETPAPRSGAEAFEHVFAFKQRTYIEKKGFSVTANLVTTRAVFDATGPMIHGVSEDVDWCQRAVKAGAELVYDDALSVGHPARQDWPALVKKWRRVTEEMFGLGGKSTLNRLKWGLRGLAMIPSAVVHTPRVLTSKALSPPDKLRCLGTLFRLRTARMTWMVGQALRASGKG